MKRKKLGIFAALAAVLFITALLITTCMDSIDPTAIQLIEDADPIVIPPGKALLRINLNTGNVARTVFPNQPGTWVYKIAITETTAGGDDSDNDVSGNGPHTFTLTAGANYSIVVYGYIDAAARTSGDASLQGTHTITGATGTTTPTIALSEIHNDGDGFFTFSLTPPAGVTSALAIEAIPGGTSVTPNNGDESLTLTAGTANDATTTGASDDPIPLTSGFYRVAVSMSQTGYQSVTLREVVHIYQNMTSHFTRTLPALSRNVWNVTYVNDGGTTLTALDDASYAGVTVNHGNTIAAAPAQPTSEVSALLPFEHWSRTAGGTTAYTFGGTADPVYRDISLFAVYTPAAEVRITIAYTATGDNFEIDITPDTFNLADLLDLDQDLTITVTNYAAAGYSALTWEYSRNGDTGNFDGTGVATIPLDDAIYLQPDEHEFYIEGTRNSMPFSATITYTLSN